MSAPNDTVAIERASRVRLMIFDVDGVLTDGSLHFGPEGEVSKTFNVLDGHGIKLLHRVTSRHRPWHTPCVPGHTR